MKSNLNIFMVRHGKTNKAANDMDRELTTEGINQAKQMSVRLAQVYFEAAYISPAQRTQQTAQIIDSGVDITLVPELYLLDEKISIMSKDLGKIVEGNTIYPPLEEWLKHEHGEHLNNFGITAAKTIKEKINLLDNNSDEMNILIVGHAVLLNAMALHLAEDERNKTFCLVTPLQEAECLVLSNIEGHSCLIQPTVE